MDKSKILILFHSTYGHIYKLAQSFAEGVKEAGAEPVIMKVEDLVPDKYLDDYAKQFKQSIKDIPTADPRKDLKGYDGYIIGTPTRFGNMAAQMKNFWDQTGGDWVKGSLTGKPATVFVSTATQHGGQESTILSSMIPLLHHGCIYVGLPVKFQNEVGIDEVSGGSNYGVSTIAGNDGSRQPSEVELLMAKNLGKHLAEIAIKLKA